MTVFACHIPPGAQWTDWSDVLAYNPYVYPGWGQFAYGEPNWVSSKTIELRRRTDSIHRVAWLMPVAFQMDPGRTPRGLTAAEHASQAYLGLIHGAKGILYFSGRNLYAQDTWDALSRLARQIEVLSPAILAPALEHETEYRPIALDAARNVFPDVQAALFRHPDGRHLLLAANSRPYPVTTGFTVAGLPDGLAVNDVFSEKTWPVENETFRDELESYGVRAYDVTIQNSEARSRKETPIQVAVTSEGHPERGLDMTPFPAHEIRRRRNVMPNPTFAIQSIPGVPDYIRPNMFTDWPLVGAPGAGWGIETNNPYHGEYCLRLVHRLKGGEPAQVNQRITTGVYYPPALKKPTPYTFSFYARAAREGDELSLYMVDMTPNSPAKRWRLTTDWQRYSFTAEMPSERGFGGIGAPRSFYLYTWAKDAVVWIDAMQMEEGEIATEFTLE